MSEGTQSLSRHVQTVIVALATGLLAWVGYSIQELKVEVAVLSIKVDQLEKRPEYASVTVQPMRDTPFDKPLYPFDIIPVNATELRRK